VSMVVLTGAVRAGKSAAAERLAASRKAPVVVAVAGWGGDEEMGRRIEAHRGSRPLQWEVREVEADPAWIADVPRSAVLVLDCLATLIGRIAWEAAGEAELASADMERQAGARADALVRALAARTGDTVVVTNEAGWGVVPATAAGRLFRDLLGRANRELIASSGAAYLVIDGRMLDLAMLPAEPAWPDGPTEPNPPAKGPR
jgi:adenosylcobinamide kinase/adenosylcobinamide-phosphate guanylyltransferase